MSRQVVVALPAWVRRRLGVEPGSAVYWHRHRAGEVVLTVKADRASGPPGRQDLEEELARVMAERDGYKRQALGLELGERRAVFTQGYERALSNTIPVDVQVEQLRAQVAEVLALLKWRRPHVATTGARRAKAKPAAPADPDRAESGQD